MHLVFRTVEYRSQQIARFIDPLLVQMRTDRNQKTGGLFQRLADKLLRMPPERKQEMPPAMRIPVLLMPPPPERKHRALRLGRNHGRLTLIRNLG